MPVNPAAGSAAARLGDAVHLVEIAEIARHALAGAGEQAVAASRERHRLAESVGEGARLRAAGLDQHEFSTAVGRGGALLGAGRDGGDQVDEVLEHAAGEPAVGRGGEPVAAPGAGEVRDEQRHIDDDIAVVEAGGELGIEDAGGAGVLTLALQIVDDGEVVLLRLLLMDGEGVGDVDRRVLVGGGIGRHHASEQGDLDPVRERRLLAQRLEIRLAVLEERFRRFRGGLTVARSAGDLRGILSQPLHLRPAQNERLPRFRVLRFGAVEGVAELVGDRLYDARIESLGEQRIDDLTLDDLLRPHRHRLTQGREREGVVALAVGDAPVALQALGRDAGAHGRAERQPLGETGVVAVEQAAGIAGKPVDLDEAGLGHRRASSF